MGIHGLIKATSYYNRVQQRRDWALIILLTGKELQQQSPPDFTKSVKEIDKYMEQVCKENGLNSKEILGCG